MNSSQLILLSGLLFLIPAYIQLRNYYIVKSNSYLIFATLFFLSVLDQILVSIDSNFFVIEVIISLSFVLIHLILIQLASELINHKLNVSSRVWITHGTLTFLSLFTLKYFLYENMISDEYSTIKFLIGEPLRIVAGFALIQSITRSNLIIKTSRTSFIQNGWIITGGVFILSGLIQFAIYGVEFFYKVILDGENSPISTGIAEGLSLFSVLFLALFASIIAIFYPEAMLLSHTQLIKASKLYDLMAETEENDETRLSKLFFRSEAPETLIDYIKNIPDDVLEEINKDKQSSL